MVVWGGPNDTLAPPKTALGGAAAMGPPPSYAPGLHKEKKTIPRISNYLPQAKIVVSENYSTYNKFFTMKFRICNCGT